MANTIRIIVGLIMLTIFVVSVWMSFVFTKGRVWEYFTSLQSIIDFTTLILLPALSAWLLLLPKSSSHARTGLVISVILILFVIANQALRSYLLTGQL